MLQRGKSGVLGKTTYAGDVKECQESNSDDVEPDWDPASNLMWIILINMYGDE